MTTYQQALKNGLQKPIRNRPYLNYVGSLPCVVCGHEPAGEAHHITQAGYGGMGTKASDLFVFPVCRMDHTMLHADVAEWEDANGFQWEHICLTIHKAITDGVLTL